MNKSNKYICNICNKNYSSKSSLCNHNKKFHKDEYIPNVTICNQENIIQSIPDDIDTKYLCKYCNKNYSNRQNKWKHEQKCKKNHIKTEETKQKELEVLKLKEEKEILRLKIKLANTDKVDNNITIKKLNKMLHDQHTKITNSAINSTVNSNNQIHIVNNIQLIGFGKEEFTDLLSYQQKKSILNAKSCCLEKLIEVIHCGAYNQFKNIIVTNNKDNYMYKYDDDKYQFILSTKSDVLNSLIDYRLCDLEVIYNDLLEDNKIKPETKDCIEKFINKINYSDEEFTDINGKTHENYRNYKINEIKVLLFNNSDKILKGASLLLTTNEVPINIIV